MRTSSASRMSALPQRELNERLPCLAMRTPAPAATNAAAVEMLNVVRGPAAGAARVDEGIRIRRTRLAPWPGAARARRRRSPRRFPPRTQRNQQSRDLDRASRALPSRSSNAASASRGVDIGSGRVASRDQRAQVGATIAVRRAGTSSQMRFRSQGVKAYRSTAASGKGFSPRPHLARGARTLI
jgi:hypothetical protein